MIWNAWKSLVLATVIICISACAGKPYKHINEEETILDNSHEIQKIKSELADFFKKSQRGRSFSAAQIVSMSVSDLAKAIREKYVSSEEASAAFLSRALELNASYNAIVTYNVEALARARAADEAMAAGESWGPLHGVPFTIKDTYSTKGIRTTAGSENFREYIPSQNAVVVQKLLDAGGVLLGKTNTPSMAMDIQTSNNIFGTTENAVAPGFSAGGSSGGAAVAVAQRFTPFDIGSDIAGSIRIPAAFNGVYGFRPTFGHLSLRGHIPPGPNKINGIRRMAVPGPLAKSIDDIEFLLPLLAGPGEGDHRSVPLRPATSRSQLETRNLRIAWTDHFGGVVADESIREAMSGLMERLKAAGAQVEKTDPKEFPYEKAWEGWGAILGHQSGYDRSNFMRWLGDIFTRSSVAATPTQRKIVGPISVPTYMQNLELQDECIDRLEHFLAPYDVWIVPVTATTVFRHISPDRYFGEFPVYDQPILVDSKPVPYWVATISFTTIFSLTESPVVALPIGKDKHGLPIGAQIVGKRFSDLDLLRVAKIIDQLK